MQWFKIKIRPGADVMTEVYKDVTAAEFIVLQFIHGDEAIVGCEFIKEEKYFDLDEERERLKGRYDIALGKQEGRSVDVLFGFGNPVPERLPKNMAMRFGMDEDTFIRRVNDEARKQGIQKSVEDLSPTKPASHVSLDQLVS